MFGMMIPHDQPPTSRLCSSLNSALLRPEHFSFEGAEVEQRLERPGVLLPSWLISHDRQHPTRREDSMGQWDVKDITYWQLGEWGCPHSPRTVYKICFGSLLPRVCLLIQNVKHFSDIAIANRRRMGQDQHLKRQLPPQTFAAADCPGAFLAHWYKMLSVAGSKFLHVLRSRTKKMFWRSFRIHVQNRLSKKMHFLRLSAWRGHDCKYLMPNLCSRCQL